MGELNLAQVVQEQRHFFESGETESLSYRLTQLTQLEKLLRSHEADLQAALVKDLGKAPLESYLTEIGLLYRSLAETKKNLKKWVKPQRKKTPLFLWPAKSYTLASSYGVTVIMSAYNYPLLLALDPLIGSLTGGNTAIVALSEDTPHVNQVLIAASKNYFKENYLYFYQGNRERNTELLKETVDYLFFTGSSAVGKVVLQAASQHLTPVTLELGGKSPALVTKNANVKTAAERIVWGKFLNAGQTCVAPDYCLVDQAVADEFIASLKVSIQELYGQETQQNPDYGRIVNQRHSQRLINLLTKDQSKIIWGGKSLLAENFIEPTLLKVDSHESPQLASMKEEIFGPILPILIYQKRAEAENLINSQPSPLAFYPFSENKAEITELVAGIQAGGCTVNDTVLHLSNSYLPFGGVGMSGMGSYHGKASFTTFTHQKAVLVRHSKLRLNLMFPPYTNQKAKIIRRFLK